MPKDVEGQTFMFEGVRVDPPQKSRLEILSEQLLELKTQKEDLKERLKETEAQLTETNRQLREEMDEKGLMSFRGRNGHTFYVHNELRVNCPQATKEETMQALEGMGLGFLVKQDFETVKLKAILTERMKEIAERKAKVKPGETYDGEDGVVPPELQGLINVYEDVSVRAVRS